MIYKDDTAIIEGEMTLQDVNQQGGSFSTTTKIINFPNGFTKDNCFVSSIGTKYTKEGFGYGTFAEYDVFTLDDNIIPFRVMFKNNNTMQLNADNIYNEITIKYQIVLEKK